MIVAVQLYKPQPQTGAWRPQEAVDVEWVLVDMEDPISAKQIDSKMTAEACAIALTADPKYVYWEVGRVIECCNEITVLKDPA